MLEAKEETHRLKAGAYQACIFTKRELIRVIIKVYDTTKEGARSRLFPANFVELIDPEKILNRRMNL
ncbi:11412_t:CDS:2 [Diversispora eburnea]|uniref:11412_t:CDS:1 n=1 Tax=Diversispora eburnea TaxID=1213867 RepID=A0A9N8VT05_9GLOM|nr:11412_t:CDS:2 [Diversispora eburnea]